MTGENVGLRLEVESIKKGDDAGSRGKNKRERGRVWPLSKHLQGLYVLLNIDLLNVGDQEKTRDLFQIQDPGRRQLAGQLD